MIDYGWSQVVSSKWRPAKFWSHPPIIFSYNGNYSMKQANRKNILDGPSPILRSLYISYIAKLSILNGLKNFIEVPFLAYPKISELPALLEFFKFLCKQKTGLLETQIKFWDYFESNTFATLLLQRGLWTKLILFWANLVLVSIFWRDLTVIGGRVGYYAWTMFCYVWLKLDWCEYLGQSGIWTSLDGQLCFSFDQ